MSSRCTSGIQKPRNEALLEADVKQASTTRHPWSIACDANMCPEDSEKSLLFSRELMHAVAPKGASTCRSKERLIMWLRVVVPKEKSHRWRWLKVLSRGHVKLCLLW